MTEVAFILKSTPYLVQSRSTVAAEKLGITSYQSARFLVIYRNDIILASACLAELRRYPDAQYRAHFEHAAL